ncbi:MAG: helix-turn-helix transcriptional regulator [Gammaproteobacteria bacterium]
MTKTLKQLRTELLQNPDVRAEYEAQAPEFELAQAIIGARIARGLTQEQLAARMGTSQSYIARLESGTTLPSTRTLMRIAKATETRPHISFTPA